MPQLALTNGKIYIGNKQFRSAALINNGLFEKTGNDSEILASSDSCRVIDLKGRTVVPGFNDSHMHLSGVAASFMQADLSGSESIEELLDRLGKYLETNPEMCKKGLKGRGFNQDLFIRGEARIPNRHDLDKISTELPVVIRRICGHVAVANTKAIEMTGLSAGSPQIEGGTFGVEADGYPDGIFTENAADILSKAIPPFTVEEYEPGLLRAMDYAYSVGLTSVQSNDARPSIGDQKKFIKMMEKLYTGGQAKLRYHHQLGFKNAEDFRQYLENEMGKYYTDDRLSFGPLKLFKDGSLGGRTGLMRKEYADDPGNKGVSAMTAEEMDAFCKLADEYGVQVITHVIGDGAVQETMECYEKVLHDGENPLRHSLNHCQITDMEQLKRIAADKLLIQYQPIFLNYDLHVVEHRVGKELASTSYAFATAEKLGIPTSYGTDCPVEDCNPLENIYCAVTRRDLKGFPDEGFNPAECVDVFTAVDAYTCGSAYCQFMEDRKGKIAAGYYADAVVLDTDIFSCDPEQIKTAKPIMTIIGGEIVYSAE